MRKKKQSWQPDTDFDSFDPVPSDTGSDFDSDDSASSGFDTDFDTDDSFGTGTAPRRPVRGRSPGGNGRLVVILSVVIVLLLGAGAFLLLPRNTPGSLPVGAAAPTGKTAYLDPGCGLLLNELLVTADSGLSQKQLEVELVKLDGGIVGYLPVLNQYQIRFNTDTKDALNEKKQALESVAGIVRADYNYLLDISVFPGDSLPDDLPVLPEKTLGLLGGVPPEAETAAGSFLLSSVSSGSAPDDPPSSWISAHKGSILPSFRADRSAELLSRTGSQYFASCLYFEANKDGSVYGVTTTCALRYQLFCLVNAGAETVAFPFTGPGISNENDLSAENELNELFLKELEKDHPSFLVCKSWKEKDFLISMFTGTEAGRRHLVTVSPFSGNPLDILDAARAGKPVYASLSETGGADMAAYGSSAETASFLAAAQLASLCTGDAAADPSSLKKSLLVSCGVLVSQEDGTVIPGWMQSVSGSSTADAYRLLTLTARDSRTGETIPNVTFTANTGAGSFTELSASGRLSLLLPDGSFSVSAAADQYTASAADSFPDRGNEAVVYLAGTRTCGYITGKIRFSGGTPENLSIRFRNTRTGVESSDMPISPDYRMEVNPGEYDLIVSGHNRTPVTVYGISVSEGAETTVPAFTLSVLSDLPGTASGMIKDAMTGGALEGVSLNVFEGVDAPETGTPAATATSDSRGEYSLVLPGGVYTAYLTKNGYRPDKMLIRSEGETTIGDQDCTITPTVPEGSVRIVLDWGPHPNDLDSHLVNKAQGIHTYYSNKVFNLNYRENVSLDVDALGEMLPDKTNRVETTTIHTQLAGKYTFYIQDYSNRESSSSRAMADSGAKVTVFYGTEKLVFEVPDQYGTLWEVFTLENGIITPSGTFTYHADPVTVGQD